MTETKLYLVTYSLGRDDSEPLGDAPRREFRKSLRDAGFRSHVQRSGGTKIKLAETTIAGMFVDRVAVGNALLDAERAAQAKDHHCRLNEVMATQVVDSFAADADHPLRDLMVQHRAAVRTSAAAKAITNIGDVLKDRKK